MPGPGPVVRCPRCEHPILHCVCPPPANDCEQEGRHPEALAARTMIDEWYAVQMGRALRREIPAPSGDFTPLAEKIAAALVQARREAPVMIGALTDLHPECVPCEECRAKIVAQARRR